MLIHVTGAKGSLGRHVTRSLAALGEVHGTDIDEMDIADHGSVMSTLKARPPSVMVHLAALKGNQPSRDRPLDFFRVNTLGTVNLLEACRRLGVGKFVFVSSISVHGPSNDPVDESSPWAPLHPYGGSKAAAEAIVLSYSQAYDLSAIIFRPNFIVGPIAAPHPYLDNIIYDFIEAIHQTGVIELAGDGQYQREWLHPRDVAAVIALAVSASTVDCETYNLSGNRVTMMDLATRIIERVGRGKVNTNPSLSGFSLISSSEKVWLDLGWKPEVDLDTLIGEIWNEYRSRIGAPVRSHHRD